MWDLIAVGAISVIGGIFLGMVIMAICAAGGRADAYTEGYVVSNNHYENLIDEKGLREKWNESKDTSDRSN